MKHSCSLVLSGVLAIAATATASSLPFAAIPKRQHIPQPVNTTFDSIAASPELNWIPCYAENYECSKLTVPLDYEDESAGTTDVAFIRYFLGDDYEDLIFNPGGPGQSGVDLVLTGYGVKYGPLWKYNFVSFDPRGINHSGPKLLCSPSASNLTNVLGRRQNHDLGDLSETWEARLKENIECSNNNKDTDAKYVGTSAAVQDMMHFVELQAELKGEVPEEAMINYYGVSYGTVIGHTLAAMYPDRIRRLLVDGNVYSAAHYQGWNPVSLDDLAYSIYTFSRLCFEAGTAWCKLAEGMTSPDDVQARFDAVVAKLYENPCTVGGATVDDNAFLNQVHRSLYFPRQGDADGRNYTFLADSILQYENCASGNGSTVAGDFKKRAAAPYVNDVEIGIITAVDIAGRYPWSTYEEWKAATDQFHATHPYGAEGYASSNGLIGLAMDSFVPPESQFFPGFEHINTSAPILFINTVADPITPRSAAYQMSALFEGSAVILVNGPGHGFSSSPSDCANQYLAAYFADGTVPEAHTWCETSVEADYYFGGVDPTIQSI